VFEGGFAGAMTCRKLRLNYDAILFQWHTQ
jgi:hypothetical protein